MGFMGWVQIKTSLSQSEFALVIACYIGKNIIYVDNSSTKAELLEGH